MSHDNSILVLGAGELGMAVLRSLARRAAPVSGVSVAALLRPPTIESKRSAKAEGYR
jgi:saccharopine dehydrogenase-like NADP-dependent oxidoreductase